MAKGANPGSEELGRGRLGGRVGKDRVAEIDAGKWTEARAKSRLRKTAIRDS